MKSSLHLKVLAGLLLAFVGNASAAVFTNVPLGGNNGLPFAYFGNQPNPSGDSPKVGEVFTLNSATTLSSFSFYALGDTTPTLPASLQLNVAQWNPLTNAQNQAVNVVGPTLLTVSGTETFNSVPSVTSLDFGNLGLSLNANTKYIAYLTSTDPTLSHLQLSRTQSAQDATGFGVGHAFLQTIDNSWQLPFAGNGFLSLEYTAITAVPEPSTYAALMGLVSLGFIAIRRRFRVAA